MQSTDTITLFHLARRDGTPIFLHPFVRRGSTDLVRQETALSGSYGREPRVESLTLLRNELYRRIENDVRDWINEQRFIPRFLIAAGAFMLTFLFMAIVIRDPIPVIDETLISLGVGIVVFILVGRRFEQSKVAGQKRVMIRSRVDSVVFSEDSYVVAVEELLHRLEETDHASAVASTELAELAREIRAKDPAKTARIIEYLRALIHAAPYRGLERSLRKGRGTGRFDGKIETGMVVPALVTMHSLLAKST